MINKKRILTIIYTVIAVIILEVAVWAVFFSAKPNTEIDDKIKEIQNLITENSIYEFDNEKAIQNALSAYVFSIENDMHAYYFAPVNYGTYMDEQAGNFTGIGVKVLVQSGNITNGLQILRVLGNSPAEQAGLMPLDKIIKVNNELIEGKEYNETINSILGEPDTDVLLTVLRDEAEYDYTVTRKHFMQREVDFKIINGNIGFIRVHDFNTNAYPEFEKALNELLKLGVEGFIFDVRNNPGGELNTVKNMIDLLVPKDEIVILQYNNSEYVYESTGKRKTDLPMVVLLNGSSASASELFASSLRDLVSAPLVGEQSYGKGTGQTTYSLSDGSGLKITTFRYVSKSRTNYDQIGLKPDFEIEMNADDVLKFYTLDETNDTQLMTAIEALTKNINKGKSE